MSRYEIEPLPLEGAFLLYLPRFEDRRGFFAETFRQSYEKELNLPAFVQDNLSYSVRGVLRGLHFQKPPSPQAKLVTALYGKIRDVIVDLRPSSPTYKRWHAVELSGDASRFCWLYVPVGFAHGFYVLSQTALVLYKCSAYYDPAADGGIRWNDPSVGIEWGLEGEPILSEKDARLPLLEEISNPFAL
ncbi:MAG: dTDP-4-dehydrorhamnose 3,5-epimerase [Bacteroidia bacterium]|nr:dTDP-4-dehydrorhamnose 3,5-epimerase [Bacteroidia bacterium]MCX7764821.1 dTDP-4-dehydrorhamnose 3,5-epimerase [Bacteroidia bacterium]MDW8057518.1 dTDP-4-dehydrorhamnose 3,5-epimerase [Bacteroidia bacterium]